MMGISDARVHENIRVPRLRTAPRPRCQPVTHYAGCILANTGPHQGVYYDVNSNQGASLRVFVSRANCFRGLLLSMSTV